MKKPMTNKKAIKIKTVISVIEVQLLLCNLIIVLYGLYHYLCVSTCYADDRKILWTLPLMFIIVCFMVILQLIKDKIICMNKRYKIKVKRDLELKEREKIANRKFVIFNLKEE